MEPPYFGGEEDFDTIYEPDHREVRAQTRKGSQFMSPLFCKTITRCAAGNNDPCYLYYC